jgi:uncharacterized membrane protein
MPISLNGEIIIGLTLIAVGVFSFAKGASRKRIPKSFFFVSASSFFFISASFCKREKGERISSGKIVLSTKKSIQRKVIT